jgi:hypothetical protein
MPSHSPPTMSSSKVSFTIRRPSPPSRTDSPGGDSDTVAFKLPALPRHLVATDDSKPGSPLARSATSSPDRTPITTYYDHQSGSSDDDDDDREQEDLLTSFDQIAVQRCVSFSLPSHSCLNSHKSIRKIPTSSSSSKKRKSDNGPLVIPVLKNKDWREVARKRRSAAQFVPPQAGRDGNTGGLGTKDAINTGPVLAGLQIKKKETTVKIEIEEVVGRERDVKMETEETEDEVALRAVLASAEGGVETEGPVIRMIPTPVSESDALKQDVEELPGVATLEDYDRIPVSQFGAAMLRGMGWKEGTAASRNGKGRAEPYLPQARPALLGIGAKEREVPDDGSGKKRNGRPERRYVPVVRKERDDERLRSGNTSRRSSRSPDGRKERSYDDRYRDSDRERRDRERDRDRDRYRGKERDGERERERDGARESDRRRNGSDRRRNRSRETSRS